MAESSRGPVMRIVAMAVALLGAISLLAQPTALGLRKGRNLNVWSPSGSLLTLYASSSHASAPGTLTDASGRERRLPKPPIQKISRISFLTPIQAPGGEPFLVRQDAGEFGKDIPGIKGTHIRVFGLDQDRWAWESEPLGVLEWPVSFRPILLSRDRLLGVSSHPRTFQEGRKSYPFAVFRRGSKGVYALEKFVEAGLEQPFFKSDGQFAYAFSPMWTVMGKANWVGDHTVFWHGCGLFWVFDEKGNLRRFRNLYGLEEGFLRSESEPFGDAVLGVQPNKSGNLVISALGKDAVERYGVYLSRLRADKNRVKHDGETADKLGFGEILAGGAWIDWWSLDPIQGQLHLMAPPDRVDGSIRTHRQLLDFNWRFRWDGNLLIESHGAVHPPHIPLEQP